MRRSVMIGAGAKVLGNIVVVEGAKIGAVAWCSATCPSRGRWNWRHADKCVTLGSKRRGTTMEIREVEASEFELVWPIIRAVLSTEDTWAYDSAIGLEAARAQWTTPPCRTFAACEGDRVLGCYVLHPNHGGPGDHVSNAGYMVAPEARGRGVGSRLCEHSLAVARAAGFRAMQFNSVVATNAPAVHLWQKHGFAVVGRVPQAFRHPVHGLTDILIMHRFL